MAQSKKKSSSSSGGRKKTNKAKNTAPKKNTAGKKTAAKQSTSPKKSSKTAAAAAKKRDGGSAVRAEILILLFLLVCGLLFLSNLSILGTAGASLKAVQLGLFGTAGYIFPIYLVCMVFYFLNDMGKREFLPIGRILASVMLFLCICAMFGIFFGDNTDAPYDFARCYSEAKSGLGGGALGGLLYINMNHYLDAAGTYLVLIILIVILIMILRGKPILQTVQQSAEHMRMRAEEQRRYNEKEAEVRRVEEELRWLEEEQERKEAYERLNQRKLEVEKRRMELHARSLAFGEATRLERPEEAAEENNAAAEGTNASINNKKETKSAENLTEARAKKGTQNDTVSGKRVTRRTLGELEEMDRRPEGGSFADTEKGAGAPRRDYRIHGIQAEPKTAELNESAILADGTSDQTSAAAQVKKERRNPVRRYEDTVSTDPADGIAFRRETAERPAAKQEEKTEARTEQPAEPVVVRHPAEAEFSDDEAMAGYDEFDDAPNPLEVVLQEGKAPVKEPANENRKSAFSTSTGSVWADKRNPGSNAGRVFTSAPREEEAEPVKIEVPVVKKEHVYPPLSLLNEAQRKGGTSTQAIHDTADKLQQTLSNFGVGARVTDISCGPTVTRYELQPDQGVKVRRIVDLSDDIKLNLAAADIRIEAPIPGKAAVGIEVPNEVKQIVSLKELLDSDEFRKFPSKVGFGVGKDIGGKIITADLARMPHLLIAGATGSGKSVCINTIIISILYKAHPDDVKLIMIDPKVVELSVYNGIPHLLIPVVTDPKKAAGALNWAVGEMTDRYKKFADLGVRDIKSYNKTVEEKDDPLYVKMPQIVVIVDELADLMMVAAGEVEEAICRLAQLARAAGIHLVIATQRPSVNVITGLIKANVPSRIAFAVSSGTDSRTILDMNGAEKLLGYGDMLFAPSSYPKPVRVQGAFVSDEEVQRVVGFLKDQSTDFGGTGTDDIMKKVDDMSKAGPAASEGDKDDLFEKAGRFIIEKDKASIGNLQRAFRIGFNRAARIMDQLCDYGVVGPEEGTKARQILMTMEQFEELVNGM